MKRKLTTAILTLATAFGFAEPVPVYPLISNFSLIFEKTLIFHLSKVVYLLKEVLMLIMIIPSVFEVFFGFVFTGFD